MSEIANEDRFGGGKKYSSMLRKAVPQYGVSTT